MATQFTANTGLGYWQHGDRGWDAPFQADVRLLDGSVLGNLAARGNDLDAAGNPASLVLRVAPGQFRNALGALVPVSAATVTVPASATTFVWVTEAGAVASGAAWPSANYVPIASVVSGASLITAVADARVFGACVTPAGPAFLPLAGGTFADAAGAAVLHTGTAHGTQVAGSASELLGFHGAAPTAQRSGAAQAAVGALATAALTDSTGGTASTALAAIADAPTANAVASLAAQEANTIADLAALRALVNELRAALVAKGTIKGSA